MGVILKFTIVFDVVSYYHHYFMIKHRNAFIKRTFIFGEWGLQAADRQFQRAQRQAEATKTVDGKSFRLNSRKYNIGVSSSEESVNVRTYRKCHIPKYKYAVYCVQYVQCVCV